MFPLISSYKLNNTSNSKNTYTMVHKYNKEKLLHLPTIKKEYGEKYLCLLLHCASVFVLLLFSFILL